MEAPRLSIWTEELGSLAIRNTNYRGHNYTGGQPYRGHESQRAFKDIQGW